MGHSGLETHGSRSQNRPPDVPQCLDNRRGARTMMDNRLKVEIAQLQLSDLGCGWLANMLHTSRNPFDL